MTALGCRLGLRGVCLTPWSERGRRVLGMRPLTNGGGVGIVTIMVKPAARPVLAFTHERIISAQNVPTGHEEAHGTIIGRAEGGKWRVRVDKDEAEICGVFKEWIESSDNGKERYCTSCVAETQKVCTVRYEGRTVGSEIAGFRFDTSDPLAPFAITGFNAKGPAQSDGVMVGWFLDVGALLKEESFIELEGEELGVVPRNLSEVASNIDQFQKRLTALLQLQDVSLRFVNGLDFQLLPQCNVKFDQVRPRL
ncbi:unnamed protein product [Effrenium voratum]|nr:unnamed protein product [Effrenium voratum]